MTSQFTFRPVKADEYESYARCIDLAFGGDYDPELAVLERELIPLEETLAAFDGDLLVGTEGLFRMTITIPGGTVPMGGVTAVSVLPTHRRRGVLTGIMRQRLEGMHEQGQWLAGLWASESVIYGRFGYGVATERLRLEVDKRRSRFAGAPASGEVRLVQREEADRVIPPLYERAALARPGMIGRAGWWKRLWADLKDHRDGRSALNFAVHSTAGVDDGYAVYRTRFDWSPKTPSEVYVEDLQALSASAYAGTWRYLLDIDLMDLLVATRRPVDEPLQWILADRGAVDAKVTEGMWLRLVDIAVALSSRAYAVDGALVLQVEDAFCPWNSGRYLLEAGAGAASCVTTSRPPDIRLGAADLGAIYMGGVRPSLLAQARRVDELTPGALETADALFGCNLLPWCDRVF